MPLGRRSFSARYPILHVIAITAWLAVQGCAMAAPAAITYGVNKITTPATPTAQPAQPAQPAARRTYPEYLTEMERINMEREKSGLSPRPIMTQEEWVAAAAAGRPVPAPSPAPTAPAAPSCEKAAETK